MRKACLTVMSVALLVGCSTDITGDAIADSPTDQTFDPCTIPDSTITAAGLDPASRASMADRGYTTPGWTICSWQGPAGRDWYSYSSLFSPVHTLNDVEENPDNANFAPLVLSGREAVTYHSSVSSAETACDVAFDTQSGVAVFTAMRRGSRDQEGDLCEIVTRHTRAIAESFPQS